MPVKIPEMIPLWTTDSKDDDLANPRGVIDNGDEDITYTDPEIDPDDLTGKEGEEKDFNVGPGDVDAGEPMAYLLNIYYDFAQSYIRDDAVPELEKLQKLLDDNPEYVVEIGSHTDSRGSYATNRILSQRRAESVVRWLTKEG